LTGNFYIYPVTAVILAFLGGIMLFYAVKLYKNQTNKEARQLMLSSVLYITLVQVIYVIDKFLH
jgi:protoheme IX farnesyltransferase